MKAIFLGLLCLSSPATLSFANSTNPIQIVEWSEADGTQRLADRTFLEKTKEVLQDYNLALSKPLCPGR